MTLNISQTNIVYNTFVETNIYIKITRAFMSYKVLLIKLYLN